MARKKRESPRGFDDILGELEGVVQRLEQGDLPLEEALGAFERGVTLTREGERILGQAEQRVELLLKTKEGEELAPFGDNGEEDGDRDE
ncbi:MAG: exodeoxyribonuclease VII small subunit [bacterium]